MNNIKLSILIPSTFGRFNTFLPKIHKQINIQLESLSEEERQQVEVLILTDNKRLMLGDKRNKMVGMCQGEYYVFVDDDDRISNDYIKTLLDATKTGKDVITFIAEVSINGDEPKPCIYSSKWGKDSNTSNEYRRIPNHICCVKTDVGRKVGFPNILYGEDSAYSKLLIKYLKSEHHIPRTLYYYDYNENTTETQSKLPVITPIIKRDVSPIADVIILSKASTKNLIATTQQTIDTAIKGANGLPLNIIVIEQMKGVTYNNATTIHNADKFNYNKFMNLGARHKSCKAKWIVFANNDLVFKDSWLHELLIAEHELVSPHEPRDPRQKEIKENTFGTTNGKHFSGWCFMMSRELFNKIGGLDEDFPFWFADDSTIQQCLAVGVTPMIVKGSLVYHLGSTTFNSLDKGQKDDYTWGLTDKFNKKYNQDKFEDNEHYKAWKSKQ